MIKLNQKLKGSSPKTKVKLPKIEINECKMKSKDQKKLEFEMFQQAREAQIVLQRLLSGESDFDESQQRARSNSLNATMENLLLTKHKTGLVQQMKQRGSVPNIAAHIKRKLFFKSRDSSNEASPQVSPLSSPETPRSPNRSKMNPMKYIRKQGEVEMDPPNSESSSPKTKRMFTKSKVSETTYKQLDQ